VCVYIYIHICACVCVCMCVCACVCVYMLLCCIIMQIIVDCATQRTALIQKERARLIRKAQETQAEERKSAAEAKDSGSAAHKASRTHNKPAAMKAKAKAKAVKGKDVSDQSQKNAAAELEQTSNDNESITTTRQQQAQALLPLPDVFDINVPLSKQQIFLLIICGVLEITEDTDNSFQPRSSIKQQSSSKSAETAAVKLDIPPI